MKFQFIKRRKFRGKLERQPEGNFIGDPRVNDSIVSNTYANKEIQPRNILTVNQEGDIKNAEPKIVKPRRPVQKMDFRYIGLGYYLIIPLLLGVFGGLLVDKIFNTKPFFLVLFLIVGTVASFYNLLRLLRNE